MVGALEKHKWVMSEGHFGDDLGKFPKEEMEHFSFSLPFHTAVPRTKQAMD